MPLVREAGNRAGTGRVCQPGRERSTLPHAKPAQRAVEGRAIGKPGPTHQQEEILPLWRFYPYPRNRPRHGPRYGGSSALLS